MVDGAGKPSPGPLPPICPAKLSASWLSAWRIAAVIGVIRQLAQAAGGTGQLMQRIAHDGGSRRALCRRVVADQPFGDRRRGLHPDGRPAQFG
jgi:hypothetical protein